MTNKAKPEIRGRVLNFHAIGRTIPTGAIYIGRSSRKYGLTDAGWGNSHPIRDYADPAERDRVCDAHEADMRNRLATEPGFAQRLLDALDGRDLVCFCTVPRQRC